MRTSTLIEKEKKPWFTHLHGILSGTAALVAALTAVYVNVRSIPNAPPSPTPTMTSTSAAVVAPVTPFKASPSPNRRVLRLERIQVVSDGSMGSTDWRFVVEVNDHPLFSVPKLSLNDAPGKNLAVLDTAAPVQGSIELPTNHTAHIVVKGWKKSLLDLSRAADAEGQGNLSSSLSDVSIEVKSEKPGNSAFIFYLSATSVEPETR